LAGLDRRVVGLGLEVRGQVGPIFRLGKGRRHGQGDGHRRHGDAGLQQELHIEERLGIKEGLGHDDPQQD